MAQLLSCIRYAPLRGRVLSCQLGLKAELASYGKVIGKRALAILALASMPVALHFYRRSYDALFFFDQIVRLVGPSGRTFGSVLFTETGHTIILQTILDLYFKRGSAGLEGLSATWMGPPYLDYGVLGVVWMMMWLGFLMGSTYEMMMKSRGILRSLMVVSYSFIWPHIMITIETGPALNTILLLTFLTALNLVTIQLGDSRTEEDRFSRTSREDL